MYLIGAIIVSVCVGALHNDIYGWLTFGGILLLAGVWEGIDDSLTRYNKSKQKD